MMKQVSWPATTRRVLALHWCVACSQANSTAREWKAAKSDTTLEAEYSGVAVRLQLPDGSTRTVQLSKLSQADQEYVFDQLQLRLKGDDALPEEAGDGPTESRPPKDDVLFPMGSLFPQSSIA